MFLGNSPGLFAALRLPHCVPDGCVYMRGAAYEFGIMMDGRVKSKEYDTACTATLYISIHLLLMQQLQHFVDVPMNPG